MLSMLEIKSRFTHSENCSAPLNLIQPPGPAGFNNLIFFVDRLRCTRVYCTVYPTCTQVWSYSVCSERTIGCTEARIVKYKIEKKKKLFLVSVSGLNYI